MCTRPLPWQCPQPRVVPTPPSSKNLTAQVMVRLVMTRLANREARTLEAVIPETVHLASRLELEPAALEQVAQVTNIGETTFGKNGTLNLRQFPPFFDDGEKFGPSNHTTAKLMRRISVEE